MSANNLALAAQAVKDQGLSQQRASVLYNVPLGSLNNYINGRTNKRAADFKKRKLQISEEAALVQWILSMDRRGLPPRHRTVRSMANLLLEKRGDGTPETVGPNWVTRFIQRHDDLKSKFVRKFNYKRSLCENPKIIQDWFQLVREITEEYRILPDDTYNMDEIGFAKGMISTCMVITNSERKHRPKLLQPGNREWMTVINGINALGWALAPMIIFKGKTVPSYENEVKLPSDWIVKTSQNGWTTNELGLSWLKEVFDKQTRHRTKGQYRLLIIDGHGSHVSPEFDAFCMENQIVLLYMPPHSSHLLQPLDVCCFAPLKQSYGQQVEKLIRCGVNHVDKVDFLDLYLQAHINTFTEQTVRSAFETTGLIPYDPSKVLSKLPPSTPSPPSTSHGSQSSWTPQTPKDIMKLRRQSARFRNLMQDCTIPLSSPTKRFMNKYFLNFEKVMNKNVLLTQEIKEQRKANEKQARKRKSQCIRQGGAAKRIQQDNNFVRSENDNPGQQDGDDPIRREEDQTNETNTQGGATVRERAPRHCSLCRSTEHTARTCSQRG